MCYEVRGLRPDLTILVAHEGGSCDQGTNCRGPIMELAASLDSGSVDLIAAGHSHTLMNTVVNGIPIVQARSSGTAVGVADLIRHPDGRREWKVWVETLYADGASDPGVAASVAEYSEAVWALANQRVTELREPLPREGDQYALGNLTADALRIGAGTQVAFLNTTGIRAPLAAGPVTYEDLFLVHPFGNRVVRSTLTGAQLRAAMEHSLGAEGRAGVNVHVSGMGFEYDVTRPAGQRITALTLADGRPIQPGSRYTVATLDYLAQGGSGYIVLTEVPWTDAGDTDVDNLVAYLRSLPQPLQAPAAPRIRAAGRR